MAMTQHDRAIIRDGVRGLMQRKFDAETKFISDIVETFGFTQEEAEKIFRVYQKAKAVKTDVQMQRVNVTHGAYWEKEPMIEALGLYSELFH